MRGKRSKQYRKLMQQYALTFQFRTPYQVLVDAQMIQDTHRFKMDLAPALNRTLHGEVKPMITQCSIRHLFALPTTSTSSPDSEAITQSTKTALLDISRSCTLRRCGHHTLPEPLSTFECHRSVIDPNDQGTNKHRLVLAVQDEAVRRWARGVKGVPTIYVKKSVMIMEPMASASVGVKEREEKGKLRGGVKRIAGTGDVLGKRKRSETNNEENEDETEKEAAPEELKKKRKVFGTKGPNPLSMKKKKSKSTEGKHKSDERPPGKTGASTAAEQATSNDTNEGKKKRKRKHKTGTISEPAETSTMQEVLVNSEIG